MRMYATCRARIPDVSQNTKALASRPPPSNWSRILSRVPTILHTNTIRHNNKGSRLRLQAALAVEEGPATSTTAEIPVETSRAYSKLQNGSDIRGIALPGIPGEDVSLTPAMGFFIGCGFADMLAARAGVPTTALRIAVGRDPRISGPMLATALVAGLGSRGVHVANFGIATTPAMFMSCITEDYRYDGAFMITASHLPFNRNGFKMFTAEGGFEKADVTELLRCAAQNSAAAQMVPHPTDSLAFYSEAAHVAESALRVDPALLAEVDFMAVYAGQLREIIKQGVSRADNYHRPLEGFKIVVDAGNGSGGYFPQDVLAPLGADTTGSQFLEPDGMFPNHIPNPEDKTAMAAGVEAVLRAGADLGVVFDTDVDRSAVVSPSGEPINSNRYIALMSYIALRKYPGTTVVTDSVTSNGLTDFINSLGGRHMRFKRGYKNVIGKGVELNRRGVECQLMMETSGHGAMKENFFLDDGAYSAVQIIIETVRQGLAGQRDVAATLLSSLREPLEAAEFRMKIMGDVDVKTANAAVLEAFRRWLDAGAGGAANWAVDSENFEGWRVNVNEGEGRRGWLLLRASLHDPLLVLNAESELEGGVKETVRHLVRFFNECDDDFSFRVDLTALTSVFA